MRYEYLTYNCPTCFKKAMLPADVYKSPLKCEVCSVIICNHCGDFNLCPVCRNFLTNEEFYELKKSNSTSKKSGLMIGLSCLCLMILPLILFGGIMMEDFSWIAGGGIGTILAFICLMNSILKNRGSVSEFKAHSPRIYENVRQRRNSPQ